MNLLLSLKNSLASAAHKLSPGCKEAARLQASLPDRPLPALQRVGLRIHLLLCAWCRRYGKQIRFLRQAVHEHPDEVSQATPQSLSPEVRERLKRSLRDHLK